MNPKFLFRRRARARRVVTSSLTHWLSMCYPSSKLVLCEKVCPLRAKEMATLRTPLFCPLPSTSLRDFPWARESAEVSLVMQGLPLQSTGLPSVSSLRWHACNCQALHNLWLVSCNHPAHLTSSNLHGHSPPFYSNTPTARSSGSPIPHAHFAHRVDCMHWLIYLGHECRDDPTAC